MQNKTFSPFSMFKYILIAIICCLPVTAYAISDWQLNMPEGVTPISRDIYSLHMTAMLMCAGIGGIVYGVLIFTLIRYRRSKGAVAADFYRNGLLENIWTIIPAILLIIMAIPATRVMLEMDDSSDADMTIKITASQWKWHYSYLDEGIEFYSNLATPPEQIFGKAKKDPWYLLEVDKPLVLPINKKIRFVVTSSDVIHAWWVPELGVKRDAVPGFIHEAWARIDKTGTYRGQCAELCGVDHAFMPIVVEAVDEKQFQQWLGKHQKPHAETVETWTMEKAYQQGKQLFDQHCAACHQENGQGIAPLYPSLVNSSIAVGDPISRNIDLILYGVPGSAMQAFAPQFDDAELAAIITYQRNAWGHNTGDLVTAEDIHQRRQINLQQEEE